MSDEMAIARVARASDNTTVRPADLLRAMAHDIDEGNLAVDGLILVYANRPKIGPWEYGAYRCGMTRDQEVCALAMMQERTIRSWLNP